MGKIENIIMADEVPDVFIMPGLADAHVHIESSMLTPSHFAVAAVRHGTIALVSDPHEIANVLGIEGVKFMLDNAEKGTCKIYVWCTVMRAGYGRRKRRGKDWC